MQKKWLFIVMAMFYVLLFPLRSHSQLSYYDESYYSSPDQAGAEDNLDYSSSQTSDDGSYYSSSQASYNVAYSSDRQYDNNSVYSPPRSSHHSRSYYSRLSNHISAPGERVIIIDPRVHVWGAYEADGTLIRAGLASAGSNWCSDLGRPCRTKIGSFRINSLGNSDCYSSRFPIPTGGAPMPYCMYFNGNQAIHGSHKLAEGNISHGCVRIHVNDAEWLRFNFATIGTKVIIRSY